MSSFKLDANSYMTRPLEVRKAAHVLRRLTPFLPSLTVIYKATNDGISPMDATVMMSNPLIAAMSKMTDADQDYIFDACLFVTKRYSGDPEKGDAVWADVWVQNGGLMFEDIGLFEMGQITWNVLQDTYRPFFSALQAIAQPAGKPKKAA